MCIYIYILEYIIRYVYSKKVFLPTIWAVFNGRNVSHSIQSCPVCDCDPSFLHQSTVEGNPWAGSILWTKLELGFIHLPWSTWFYPASGGNENTVRLRDYIHVFSLLNQSIQFFQLSRVENSCWLMISRLCIFDYHPWESNIRHSSTPKAMRSFCIVPLVCKHHCNHSVIRWLSWRFELTWFHMESKVDSNPADKLTPGMWVLQWQGGLKGFANHINIWSCFSKYWWQIA